MKKQMPAPVPGRSIVQKLTIRRADVMPIVKCVCAKKRNGAPTHVDYQDIVGAAFLGISDARRRFKESKKVKFSTYATTRATGSVQDLIRREHAYARRYIVVGEFEGELARTTPSSEGRLGRRDLYEVVCRLLSQLPPVQLSAV